MGLTENPIPNLDPEQEDQDSYDDRSSGPPDPLESNILTKVVDASLEIVAIPVRQAAHVTGKILHETHEVLRDFKGLFDWLVK